MAVRRRVPNPRDLAPLRGGMWDRDRIEQLFVTTYGVPPEPGLLDHDAIARLVAKYPQYRHRPPQGAVIVVDVRAWRGWAWAEPR